MKHPRVYLLWCITQTFHLLKPTWWVSVLLLAEQTMPETILRISWHERTKAALRFSAPLCFFSVLVVSSNFTVRYKPNSKCTLSFFIYNTTHSREQQATSACLRSLSFDHERSERPVCWIESWFHRNWLEWLPEAASVNISSCLGNVITPPAQLAQIRSEQRAEESKWMKFYWFFDLLFKSYSPKRRSV